MSYNCFNIQIEEPSRNILHIENSVGDSTKNIDIIQSGLYNIKIASFVQYKRFCVYYFDTNIL